MNNGEFYSSKEYNATAEYKHFPAEAYVKLKEENVSGKEIAGLGQETTTLQKKQRTKKRQEPKYLNLLRNIATLIISANPIPKATESPTLHASTTATKCATLLTARLNFG